MKAYSLDLRQRIVRAVLDQGLHPREVAARFSVGLTTVKRFVALAQADDLAPKPRPGRSRTRSIRDEHHPALVAQLAAHDDATLQEHCRLWAERQGVTVSPATMSRAITRLGWTRKKRRWQPASAGKPTGRPGATSSPTATPRS
jgi:transposase